MNTETCSHTSSLAHSVQTVIKLQLAVLAGLLVFSLICALAVSGFTIMNTTGSAAFGAILALIGTLLSARSVQRTSQSAGITMAPVFIGLLNKMIIIGGGIALGLALGLEAMWVIGGYIIVQLAALWTMRRN